MCNDHDDSQQRLKYYSQAALNAAHRGEANRARFFQEQAALVLRVLELQEQRQASLKSLDDIEKP